MRGIVPFITGLFFTAVAFAQAPVINNINPVNTHPNGRIVITGSGFSNTPAQLAVWFDQVKGTIVTSSEFAIEVEVPAQAKLNNVEVINLSTRLSVKSPVKFMPSVRIEDFNATKFTAPLTFQAPEELWDLCTCDLNNDGKPDIAATKFATPNGPYTTSTDIMLLQNQSTPGNVAFSKFDKTNLAVLNLTFATDHVVCGDLQGDGKPDLVLSRGNSPRNIIQILNNTSAGAAFSFTKLPELFLEVGHFATRMVLRDLNRDGRPEIIVTNSFNDVFYIFINQSSGGTLSFNPTPTKLSVKVSSTDVLTNYEADVQDFNGDGLPDIILNQFNTNDLYLLKNQSTGNISFGSPQRIPTPASAGGLNRLTSVDINKDGKLDIVATSTLGKRIQILFNESTSTTFTFSSPVILSTSAEPWGVDVSDIDGDQDPDIIVANRNKSTLDEYVMDVFLHNGNMASPGFSREEITMASHLRNVKAGDLDGDGKPDLAYTSYTSGTTLVGIIRNANCHKPEIENEEPLVICNGKTIRLTTAPVPNVTFTWKEGTTTVGTDDPFLDITTPGTYTVTATSESGGCIVQSEAVVVTTDTNNAPPDPTITANTPLCVGATLNLSSNIAADEYIWTAPNDRAIPSEQNPSFAVTEDDAGIYTLQLRTGQCKSNVDSIRVDVARLADFTISSNNASNTVCQGGSVTLSVNTAANHTYQWLKDGGDIATETSSTLTANQEGAFAVRVTNTELSCSTTTTPVNVMILQPPVAGFDVKTVACTNEQLSFTNQSQVDARATVLYNWNFGNGTSTTQHPTNIYTTTQTYNPTLTVSYQGITGCSDNTSASVNVVNGVQPSVTSTAPSSCPDEQVTLSVTGSFTSILWSNSTSGNSTNVLPGSYTVNTVDANGCAGEATITITEKALPELIATATPATILPGETSQLLASGADEYAWTPTETLDNPLIANPVASPAETTTYSVTGAQTGGCSTTIQVTVTLETNVNFPAGFSPNGDGINDLWNIRAESTPECILSIFDGRGRRIFEKKGENWDGTYQGKTVPDGTYYYVYGCPDKQTVTGSVLVFK